MGYRSDAAYAIVCTSTADRDKIIADLGTDQWNLIKDEVQLTDDRILYHEKWVKWYEDHLNIAAHIALMDAAEGLYNEYDTSGGTEGVLSMGIFMKLGEDSDDFSRNSWGEYELPEGYPQWHELIDETRELRIGWEDATREV